MRGHMLYLSPLSGELMKIRHPLLGCMRTPENNRGVPEGMPWAADCGLKVATSTDPAEIDRYLGWLDGLDRAGNLFAVAPDVLGDAEATWRRSAPLLPRIRALGYRVAFVAQDGFDPEIIDPAAFDVLFIGGRPLNADRTVPPNERRRLANQEWKRQESGGWAAIRWALGQGLRVHVGRVNGGPFLRQLAAAGVHSADGTKLAFGPDQNYPIVRGWLDHLAVQPTLGLEPAS